MPLHHISNRAVILTTHAIEYQAVRDHLNNHQEEMHNGSIYESGYFQTKTQTWLVGIAQVGSANSTAVAAATERAVTHFQPSVVIYVGTAGGLKDVQIGDVIAANKIYGYESGKANISFEPRPEIGSPTHALEQRALAEAKKDDWRERIKTDTGKRIPQVYVGPIAAGEKVIAFLHSETVQFLQKNYGDTLAVEMEGYGFLRAMYANQHVDTLVIRGISNIITDTPKTDNITHQFMATQHASAFAFEVLAKFQTNKTTISTPHTSYREQRADNKIRVLAVFANPMGTSRLRLDIEERTIHNAIEISKHRDNILLETRPAATFRDLSRALLNEKFQIVHIASHGHGQGLVLADEYGGRSQINPTVLQNLFQEYHETIECVVINACHSLEQGSLISQHISYTIAMDDALDDLAAIKFSEGFYDAIAAGKDIEAAYREGIRHLQEIFPNMSPLPRLIKKGENLQEDLERQNSETEFDNTEPIYIQNTKALVGVAIDLSASMKKSFINQSGNETKRLTSIQRAFKELTQSARQGIQAIQTEDTATEIDMFVYAFGLQTTGVCDLLSLWKASQQIITSDLIDTTIQRAKQENQQRMNNYQGLGKFIRSIGINSIVNLAEGFAQKTMQQQIRKRIWDEVKEKVEIRALAIGSTTLALNELTTWWNDSGEMLENAEGLLFGKSTPVTEVLTKVIARFESELNLKEKGTQPILILISDGKFSSSNPLPLAAKLRAMGVTILSCLITDKDVINPRQLSNQPLVEWSDDARIMFEMASPLKESTRIETFLLSKGWTIYPQPKLFVQANHSDVLEEFVRITLGHLENPTAYRQTHNQ
ncbi:hypothetical protein KDA_30600 [Dictyobacter alpinus]|uniref:CHAT domain-containing protein n=1 Tax=Dictyobacter alpinus TaxID=2014873 RepID=A0A402B8B2_9CHLR|nr:CHAT domain-containing protein [Dictyobacter alpinus]GCE27576.1 hypothetical protein KDA_30600 [Dictyobacter alpinus]